MFTANTNVSEYIRKNIYTLAIFRHYLEQDSICDFNCNLYLEKKEKEPIRVFINYRIERNYINDDDYVDSDYHNGRFWMPYHDFMDLFYVKHSEFVSNLMKSKLRGELLDRIYHYRISGNTRLCDIPKKLLEPETNVLDCTEAYNTKIDNLRKHLSEVFDTDHPDDLSSFNAVDIGTLRDLTGDCELYLESGTVKLEDKYLKYEFDEPLEPLPEFIETFDEIRKSDISHDVYLGNQVYAKLNQKGD